MLGSSLKSDIMFGILAGPFRGEPPQPSSVWGAQPSSVGDGWRIPGGGQKASPLFSFLRTSPPVQALAPHVRVSSLVVSGFLPHIYTHIHIYIYSIYKINQTTGADNRSVVRSVWELKQGIQTKPDRHVTWINSRDVTDNGFQDYSGRVNSAALWFVLQASDPPGPEGGLGQGEDPWRLGWCQQTAEATLPGSQHPEFTRECSSDTCLNKHKPVRVVDCIKQLLRYYFLRVSF